MRLVTILLYQKRVRLLINKNNILYLILVPNGTVKSLTAIPRDSTSVLIEYTKPIESSINGQLIGYDINYALNYPNLNWKSIRVNSSIQSYILKGFFHIEKKNFFLKFCIILV